MFDSKMEYALSDNLERIGTVRLSQKAMKIMMVTEEGSEAHNLAKELIKMLEQEQRKIENLKSVMYILANKL